MLFSIVAIAGLLIDAGSKVLAECLLQQQTIQLGWIAEFFLTRNTGMAFGMLSGKLLAGIVLPLAAIMSGWAMMRHYHITRFTAVACGLVTGGFIGNFAERLLFGYVRDMIFFPWLPWFVCNVADIFICFGVAALAFSLIFRPQDWQEKRGTQDAND